MNLFQIGGLIFCASMIILSIVAIARQKLRRLTGTMWLGFWTASALAIIWPNFTRNVANSLGIGRGTDLVMYCGLLAAAIGFFFFYLRFRQLEANLTKIVRHLAIQEARETKEVTAAEKRQEATSKELDDGL